MFYYCNKNAVCDLYKLFLFISLGDTCKKPGKHTCLKIGWDPLLCISDSLVCDGNQNCPKFSLSSDEDEQLCKISSDGSDPRWKQLALDLFKKFKPPPGNSRKDNLIETLEQHNITFDPVALEKALTGTSVNIYVKHMIFLIMFLSCSNNTSSSLHNYHEKT